MQTSELIERLRYERDDAARDEAANAIESLLVENERLKAELAKYRDAPVFAYATTNGEGDKAMLFFDEQEARQYSGDDKPIKLIVKPGEEK